MEDHGRDNYKKLVTVDICNLIAERGLSVYEGTEVLESVTEHLSYAPAVPLDRLRG